MNPVSPSSKFALLLVRTPFQAWLAIQTLRAEGISNYSLVYFTHNDSSEDKYYFKELAANSLAAQYCYVPVRRFDILAHIDMHWQIRSWRCSKSPDVILLASINAPVINALAAKHVTSELITFDDGLANILPTEAYFIDKASSRMRLYRRLLGATALDAIKSRIVRHYTIYQGFNNIVDGLRLRYFDGWKSNQNTACYEGIMLSYFVGQPFEEDLTTKQIESLEHFLRTMKIHFYVRHPRERKTLNIEAPFMDKHGLLAEDAILKHAQGQPIHLIGWYTSVLINLSRSVNKITMILLESDANSESMAATARKAGCEIVLI